MRKSVLTFPAGRSFLIIVFFYLSGSITWADGPVSQKAYGGNYVVNESAGVHPSPRLSVNGVTIKPIADDKTDLLVTIRGDIQRWRLLAEFTPWRDVNRFGYYTDPGSGDDQTPVFNGPDSPDKVTTTFLDSGAVVGLWLLNDTNGDSVFNGNDSYLFSERHLTVGAAALEHQWFMVYDVGVFKQSGANYHFRTSTESFNFEGDYDYLIFIDDDHTSANWDHNDMILGVVFEAPENRPPVVICPGDTTLKVCELSEICLGGFDISDPDDNLEHIRVLGGELTDGEVCFTPVAGDNLIRVIAVDDEGLADTCSLTVRVNLNQPPEILAQRFSGELCTQPDCRRLQISASDPDNDALEYSLVSGPGAIDALSGLLSYTPDTAGVYSFVVRVSDGCVSAQATITDTLIEQGQLAYVSDSFQPHVVYAGVPFDISFAFRAVDLSAAPENINLSIQLLRGDSQAPIELLPHGFSGTTTVTGDSVTFAGSDGFVADADTGRFAVQVSLSFTAGTVVYAQDSLIVDSLLILPPAVLRYVPGSLSPHQVAAGVPVLIHFDVELSGGDSLLVDVGASSVLLQGNEFSLRLPLDTSVGWLTPGSNELVSEAVQFPTRLVGDTIRVQADIRYRRFDAANNQEFAADFAPDGIIVTQRAELTVTEMSMQAPNAPYVDQAQSFSVRVRVTNKSQETLHGVALSLSSNGGSMFDPSRVFPILSPGDTVTAIFSIGADSSGDGGETFALSLASEETGNSGIVASTTAIIQRPASLRLEYALLGALDGTVESGRSFGLLVSLRNDGEAEVGEGQYLLSTGGVDFGIGDSTFGVISTDLPVIVTLTAPPFDTQAVLTFALTALPPDKNTLAPALIDSTQLAVPVTVVKQSGDLLVSIAAPNSGLFVPGQVQEAFRMSLVSRGVTGDATFQVNSIEFEVTAADGTPVTVQDLFDVGQSGAYENNVKVATVSAVGSRLRFDFTGLVFGPRTGHTISFRVAVRAAATAGFRLQASASSVRAEWATGPLTGQPVAVMSPEGGPLVLIQDFVATAADLKNSFIIQQNPFNPTDSAAVFAYRLSRTGTIEFRVFTLAGELVFERTFPEGTPETMPDAQQLIHWDGRNDDGRVVMNGVYVAMIRQTSTGEQATLKVAVVK